jgi:glycosyltransferase involved in cell wall biosynthesis
MPESPPDRPAVSIVIPCFMQAEFLDEAIGSVEGQTRTDWEVVIVDDGSPDDVAVVAQNALARLGDRVRLVRQANAGVAAARNAGIRVARGDFIVPLDADDRLHPEFLARTLGLLETDPTVGVAYTDWEEFGATSRIVQVPEFDFEGLCRGNHIHNTAAFRREAWESVGGYRTNLTLAFEDWDFWLGCAERGYLPRRVPGVLLFYRVRPGGRNDRTKAERQAMTAIVMANHPSLYTTRRRLVRSLRRGPRNLVRHLGRVATRLSNGRIQPRRELW